MAQYIKFPNIVRKMLLLYLQENYPGKEQVILSKTYELYNKFIEETPDIGGKKNHMSINLYLALAFFAFYDAIDRNITNEEIENLIAQTIPKKIPIYTKLNDLNKISNQQKLEKKWEKYKKLADAKIKTGEWNNSWKVELNPNKRSKGVAFNFYSCPIVDFAKSHNFMDIMSTLCKIDYLTAQILNAKLIRKHTIASGKESCDYWYLGSKDEE